MKIIDCFIFYNELDILKMRLYELYNIVDYIVLVEATKTHTGKIKKLYYEENKELFNKYNDKIIHLVTDFEEKYSFYDKIKVSSDDWYRENYQRECIKVIIDKLNLNDEDIIILSDVDEIPNKNILYNLKYNNIFINNNIIYSIEMNLYYYTIELTTKRKWYHSKIFNYFTYKNNNLLTKIRLMLSNIIINNGGWHLSYYGDIHFIKNKLESIAESLEYSEDSKNINYLNECINNNILHFNKEKLIYISIKNNNNIPSYFLDNKNN